jgi:hypothetical protein
VKGTLAVLLRPRRTARELEQAEANLVLLIRTIARLKEAEIGKDMPDQDRRERHLHLVRE